MNQGPWKFHERLFVHGNVVVDKDGKILASHVSFTNGPLIAAAPCLLDFVRAVAKRQDDRGQAARSGLKALDLGLTAAEPSPQSATTVSLRGGAGGGDGSWRQRTSVHVGPQMELAQLAMGRKHPPTR